MDEALGIQAAFKKLIPGDDTLEIVEKQIILGRAKFWAQLLAEEAKNQISVMTHRSKGPVADAGRPDFHHPEIAALYDHDLTMPEETIREILALPRETLVADLIRVMEDVIARTPCFLEDCGEGMESTFALHALHFLAELPAPEALPVTLRFLQLHEDELSFWLGDFGYTQQFARICEGGLEEIKLWMKLPGISASGKSTISSAVGLVALRDADRREDVIHFFDELLEFYLTCPRDANILDTSLISYMIGDLLTLRAVERQPLIERIWEKGYIMRVIVGDLESIVRELSSPPHPRDVIPFRSMPEQYRKMLTPVELPAVASPDKFESFVGGSFGFHPPEDALENVTSLPGRNDPCYCGSGRKFKKCCMPK